MLLLRWSGSCYLRTCTFFQILDFFTVFPDSSLLTLSLQWGQNSRDGAIQGQWGILYSRHNRVFRQKLALSEWDIVKLPCGTPFNSIFCHSVTAWLAQVLHVCTNMHMYPTQFCHEWEDCERSQVKLQSRGTWAGYTSRIEKVGNTLHQTREMQEKIIWVWYLNLFICGGEVNLNPWVAE